MMTSWQPFSRASSRLRALVLVCSALGFLQTGARAQAPEDVLSQAEVDQLRDAAFTPLDRLHVYQQILDDRMRALNDLLTKRRGHTDFAADAHDLLDQIGAIANELNDNLDEYSKHHRDVRKALPKLVAASDRWMTSLQAPPKDEGYDVVRRIALDNVKDTRDIAQSMQTDLEAYFKDHPEAVKEEKRRVADPHAVQNPEGP